MLMEEEKLYRYEAVRVSEIFDWFNQYLPCPPFEKSKWPKNAITWFKVGAQEYISKLYDLQVILSEHGVQVRTIKTEYPGKILYEDEYQIVAVSAKF